MNDIKQACTIGMLLALSVSQLSACGGGGGGSAPLVSPPRAPLTAAMPALSFSAVKTFQFSWTDVGDATHYKLLENPDSSSGFAQVGSDVSQGSQSIDHVVPLYARLNAQYILQSCNATGCTNSSSIAVSGSLVDSIGYFKASNTEESDHFGAAVALSADGSTLAVGARIEDGSAVGIDGDQTDNAANLAGAVYVFSRDSAGIWSGTPTYVKASNTEAGDRFGEAIALSADGNTLAVGATGEDGAGISGSNNDKSNSGAVYVFSRDAAGNWSDAFYIKASTVAVNIDEVDQFGDAVALSADGNTLAVGALGEDGNDTGIDGDQASNAASSAGAVYVFSRDSAGIWGGTPIYIKASNTEAADQFGTSVALSADGNTLAVGAIGEDSAGISGSNNDKEQSGAVYVFSRDASGTWSDAFYIKASTVSVNIDEIDYFGSSVALSADGNTLAVGARGEDGNDTGIDGDQANNAAPSAGAVYVFSRDSAGIWGGTPTYIKASNSDEFDNFGYAVALSADGDTLAVGAVAEDGSTMGFDGDQADNTAGDAGAIYIFGRDGGTWSQRAYVKASNTDGFDFFGTSVALSADGNTLAAGAFGERSDATGINGDQVNNAAPAAGAVYLY